MTFVRAVTGGIASAAVVGCFIGPPALAGTKPAEADPVGGDPVTLTAPSGVTVPYLVGGTVRVRVSAKNYTGRVSISDKDGRVLGSARASRGRADVSIRADHLGRERVTIMSAAQGDHDAASTRVTVTATTQDWDRGMRGPQVAALVAELKRLNFHTPPATSLYGKRVSDVVLAFQKWNRLPRTAAMNNKTWDALSTAQPVQPTTRGKGVRIEVDKTRQVASLIRDDDVLGVLHVSTGLTGNTPEGRFRIYEKGVGSLFRFMGFYGNFGLHGYIPVPKYPASHGCVREPMWIADWTYRRAPIGTPVIIYRS